MIVNNSEPVRAKHFVTHAWAEPMREFTASIRSALEPMQREEQTLWICMFAVFQTQDPSVIAGQLGRNPWQAPFTRALNSADRFLVVRNSEVNIYTRVWCCWELYCAYTLGYLT